MVLEEGHHELRAAKAARFAAWLSAHPHYGQPQDSLGGTLRNSSVPSSPFGSMPSEADAAHAAHSAALAPELRSPVLATLAALAGCNIRDDDNLSGGIEN